MQRDLPFLKRVGLMFGACALVMAWTQEPAIYRRCEVREPCDKEYNYCPPPYVGYCRRCTGTLHHLRCDGPIIENPCDQTDVPSDCGAEEVAECNEINKCVNWAPTENKCDRTNCFQ